MDLKYHMVQQNIIIWDLWIKCTYQVMIYDQWYILDILDIL